MSGTVERVEASKCIRCGHFQADAWICDDCGVGYYVHRDDDRRAPTWTAIGSLRNYSDSQATAYQQFMLANSVVEYDIVPTGGWDTDEQEINRKNRCLVRAPIGVSHSRLSSFDADQIMTRLVRGANPSDIASSRMRTCWRVYCAIAPLIALKARYGVDPPVRVGSA